MKRSIIYIFAAAVVLLGSATAVRAQLNPMGAMYYQNPYLVNPALAGTDRSLSLNLGYRSQWSGMPGAPTIQSLTAEYGATDRMGLGLNLYSDKAGLLRRTRVEGSYAYHLPLSEEGQKLHFGISFGFSNERVDNAAYRADPDVNVGRFNSDETFLDGTFGLAYTGQRLTVQGSVPNMKALVNNDSKDRVDYATFFTSVSYKLDLDKTLNGITLEPKFCFRGVKGYDNLFDLGTSVGFIDNSLNIMAMYHSTKSATFGMGMNYKKTLSVMGIYTTSTAALSNYTSGSYEVSVRLRLANALKGRKE